MLDLRGLPPVAGLASLDQSGLKSSVSLRSTFALKFAQPLLPQTHVEEPNRQGPALKKSCLSTHTTKQYATQTSQLHWPTHITKQQSTTEPNTRSLTVIVYLGSILYLLIYKFSRPQPPSHGPERSTKCSNQAGGHPRGEKTIEQPATQPTDTAGQYQAATPFATATDVKAPPCKVRTAIEQDLLQAIITVGPTAVDYTTCQEGPAVQAERPITVGM